MISGNSNWFIWNVANVERRSLRFSVAHLMSHADSQFSLLNVKAATLSPRPESGFGVRSNLKMHTAHYDFRAGQVIGF
jgi:hypothetical protein